MLPAARPADGREAATGPAAGGLAAKVADAPPEEDVMSDSGDPDNGDEALGLAQTVGHNLRRLRTRRGYSLERLAKLSGVSRAMLGQIELGRSAPTINLLWKIARALQVPFASLTSNPQARGTFVLHKANSKILTSQDGHFTSRALFPFEGERKVEFYELTLSAGSKEEAEPHPPGTVENLIVTEGTVEITVGGESHLLKTGDAILFEADQPHSYHNASTILAVMYLVMTYVESIG